jgi:hypothetical protein
MPLNPVYLPKVDGLQTETSNINSDPRSLADCTDVISNREDFLEGRHGHPSAPVVTSVNGTASDLYAYRNTTNKVFVPTYKVSNVYQFKTISQSGEEIIGGSTESSLQDINGISTTRTSQVNVKPTAFAHDERLLFLTDYGVYFRPYSTPGVAAAAKVEFPLIRSATINPTWLSSGTYGNENSHWLVPGFQTNIKIIFEIEAKEGDKGERRLASPTSRIYEMKNFFLQNTSTPTRTSNMLVLIDSLTISHIPAGYSVYMKVYRTPQFEIGTAPIPQYFLATPEKKITSATVVNSLDSSTYLYLTTNDDGIVQLEPLYNDPTQGGVAVTNHIPVPAKNVTQFRNYYIYSNLALPTLASFGIKTMPVNNDTLSMKLTGSIGFVENTVTFKTTAVNPGEVTIPTNLSQTTFTNTYVQNERDLTFQGQRAIAALNTLTRINPGSGTGQVEPYGKISKLQFMLPNSNNAVVRVTADPVGFDINKFNQPGIAAVVNTSGQVQVLFSYSSYRRIASSAGFIDFEGAVSLGATMPVPVPPATSVSYSGTFYVYNLLAESAENISIYRGNGSSYFSLLPCKNGLPYAIAKPAPVSNQSFLVSGTIPNAELYINPEYIGLLTKPQGKLFDDLAVAIADEFQRVFNSTGAVLSLSGGDLNEAGIVNSEILDYRYETVSFKKTGSTDSYEPPIANTDTQLAVSEKSTSSFIISKQNNPELIPYSGINSPNVAGPFYPPKVGDSNKAIVACAATKDSVYLLKEDGVARVFVGFNTLVPTVDGINIFDNTTFCVSAGSVQVLNDSVLFLAQNGVHSISGNNIDKVSRQIETELKKAISQCRAANKLDDIRSFANSAKGLYGLYIPTGVTSYVTYVLNIATMRWTKWSNTFNGAVTDLDGRLTTLMTDTSGNYIRQDVFTGGDPRAEVDQIDDEFVLTGTGSDVGLVRTISSQAGLGTKVLRFGSKQTYYKAGTVLYPVTVAASGTDGAVVTFQTNPPTYTVGHSLVVGVNIMLEFQPFTNSNPSTLKMFSGYHAHTEESVLDLSVSFRTEARSTFSVVKTFSTSPDNRTVYRCYIPLEATRGRFLYRKLTHVRPYQICAIPAQAIVFRETGSERVNK